MFSSKLPELLKKMKKDHIYIQTHNFPDPDAVASAYGIQVFLKHYGISSTIIYDGKISKKNLLRMIDMFQIEMQHISKSDIQEDDGIILVDAQKSNSNVSECAGKIIACIDHHPTFAKAKYSYRDVRFVGACASIIASYFHSEKIPVSKQLATALAYGIKVDTGDLARGVKELDIDMYCMLYKLADMDIINTLSMNSLSVSDLKAYGAAIQNVTVKSHIGFARIPFDCPDSLIAMISDFILDIDVVVLSVVYSVRKDGLKFSVRSKIPRAINAGSIIQMSLKGIGNGGGHPAMAGGFIPNEAGNTIKDINSFIQNRFISNTKIDDNVIENKHMLNVIYTV